MPAVYETVEEAPPSAHLSRVLQDAPLAEVLDIPTGRVISIEHPCVVQNLDNGLKSMGGEARMKHIVEHHVGDSLLNPRKPKPEPELGISLRPEDPLASKLVSVGIDTRNVLIRVTVPKRTGRKRKRGSQEPFRFEDDNVPQTRMTAPELLKRLRDNESKYTIAPVGMVHETHRFRSLPDFQTRNGDQPIFKELSAHVLRPSWSSLRNFSLDLTPGVPMHMTSFPGPPSFAALGQPYRYEYQQAAGVKFSQDDAGNIQMANTQAPLRKMVKSLAPDHPEIPQEAPVGLRFHNSQSTVLPRAVKALQQLMVERPIITRRVAMNLMPGLTETTLREIVDWVGYSFRAGPFKDTIIRYGLDPRKDPECRVYQSLMFQFDKKATREASGNGGRWFRAIKPDDQRQHTVQDGHIFDGTNLSTDGKVYQICDLKDPVLEEILSKATLLPECDVYNYGWYSAGAICKARVILRDKIERILAGKPLSDDLYALVATLPDDLENFVFEHAYTFFGDAPLAKEAATFTSEIRSMTKTWQKNLHVGANDEPDTVDLEDARSQEGPKTNDHDDGPDTPRA